MPREMPARASRMHCAHGEGSPAYAARRPLRGRIATSGGTGEGCGMGEEGQTDWRDRGRDLPEDLAELARVAEARLTEALAESDVLKVLGPSSLTSRENLLVGQAARRACSRARLEDVTATLSIAKSTYEDQRSRPACPDPKASPQGPRQGLLRGERGRVRVREHGLGHKAWRRRPRLVVRAGRGGVETPAVASERVVRAIMAEGACGPQGRRGRAQGEA